MAPGDVAELSPPKAPSIPGDEQERALQSQQCLLDILREELTRLCERFCQDANESASRLDHARLLLAGVLKIQSGLEAEIDRLREVLSKTQASARQFLQESCARELVETQLPYTALFTDLLQCDYSVAHSETVTLDRQIYLEFLRHEPKWWSLEDVLDDFEARVNQQFQEVDAAELPVEKMGEVEPVVNNVVVEARRHPPSQVLAMNAVSLDAQEINSPGASPDSPRVETASMTPVISMSPASLEEISVPPRNAGPHVTFLGELPQHEIPVNSTIETVSLTRQHYAPIHGSHFLSSQTQIPYGGPRFPGAQGRTKPSAPALKKTSWQALPPQQVPVWAPPLHPTPSSPKLRPKPFTSGSRRDKLAQKLAEEGHQVLMERKPRSPDPRPQIVDWVAKPTWKVQNHYHRDQPVTVDSSKFGGREVTRAFLERRREGSSRQGSPGGPFAAATVGGAAVATAATASAAGADK